MDAKIELTQNPVYLQQFEEVIAEAKEVALEGTWTLIKEKNGFKHIIKDQEFKGRKLRGCEGVVDVSVEEYTKLFMTSDFNFEMSKASGKNPVESHRIEKVSEECVVGYQLAKLPFPMSKRSFLFVGGLRSLGDGKFIGNFRSTSHDAKPETSKDVRAAIYTMASYIERQGDKTFVRYFSSFDLKGSLPTVVKNIAEKDGHERLDHFKKAFASWKARA